MSDWDQDLPDYKDQVRNRDPPAAYDGLQTDQVAAKRSYRPNDGDQLQTDKRQFDVGDSVTAVPLADAILMEEELERQKTIVVTESQILDEESQQQASQHASLPPGDIDGLAPLVVNQQIPNNEAACACVIPRTAIILIVAIVVILAAIVGGVCGAGKCGGGGGDKTSAARNGPATTPRPTPLPLFPSDMPSNMPIRFSAS